MRPRGVTWKPTPLLKRNRGYGILGPAVRSSGVTAEGPGDVTRAGPGSPYAVCAGDGSARRGSGGVDAACLGGGPATRGWGIAAAMYAVHVYGGPIAG